MSEHALGQTVTVSAQFTVGSTPRDPDTCSLQVRKPDGTSVTYDPLSTGQGLREYDLVFDQPGVWTWRFVGTGEAAGVYEGGATVRPSPTVASAPKYTYDISTSIGELRMLVDDRDLSDVAPATPMERRSAIFSDEELQKALDRQGGDVMLTAGYLLRIIASNRQLLVQSRRIGQTTVDYGNVRKDLMDLAQTYIDEAQKAAGFDDPADGFAEVNWDQFSGDRILTNAIIRQAG